MNIRIALALAAVLVSSAPAWPQDAPIKLDAAPLFAALSPKSWINLHPDDKLADALRTTLSQAPFQPAPGPDVLTLSAPDGVKKEKDQYILTVVFSRDGARLGEAVESCLVLKLSDCTGQLVLDIKTAAQ